MKTPLNELMAELVYCPKYQLKVSEIMKMIQPYIEKERQTIINAYNQALIDTEATQDEYAEEYFSTTFDKQTY